MFFYYIHFTVLLTINIYIYLRLHIYTMYVWYFLPQLPAASAIEKPGAAQAMEDEASRPP